MDLEPGTSGISDETAEVLVETEIPYLLYQALSSGTCILQSVCRSCLSVNNETLYSLLQDEQDNVSDMFSKITSIQVNEKDGLPNSICGTCHQEILEFYNFKTKCLNSDHVLKTILEGAFQNLDDCDDARHDCDPKDDLGMNLQENNLKVKEDELTDKYKNNETYLECLRNEMSSDDEALCIFQENAKDVNLVIVDKGKQSNLGNKKQYKEKLSKISKQRKHHICPHCPKKYKTKKALHGHMQKVHKLSKSGHGCEQCTDTFTCEDDLKLHQSLHNRDSVWKCNQCHKEYNVRAALRRHLQRHMSSKRYSCDICGKQFVENYAMLRHRVVHSGLKPEKKYNCHLCDKRFADRRALESHGVTAHGAGGDGDSGGRGMGPCACVCGKRFASRRLLASHRRVHNDDKPYACKYCDKRFRHDSARNTHHRTHTGERPYVCSVCGKTFIQHSNLTMHMRSHTGERPYSCSKCNSKFSTGSALKNHERSHTGERPYSCSVCGKRFARGSMKAHMRIHTGERPFACAVCPRRFNNSSHLREHSRLHTGERPFECAMCTLKFPTKSHLIKHVRIHEKKKSKGVVMYRPYKVTANNETNNIVIVEETPLKGELIHEAPMVAQELTVPNDEDTDQTEVIVLNNPDDLSEGFIVDDMNLLAVNEGEVSISATSAMVEGTIVKLYQLDQSLVQIHRTPGQLTISKITSKMTANF